MSRRASRVSSAIAASSSPVKTSPVRRTTIASEKTVMVEEDGPARKKTKLESTVIVSEDTAIPEGSGTFAILDWEEEQVTAKPKAKATKGRKKTAAEPQPADFPTRVESAWKAGAHISAAGGVENAIINAAKIGANAFGLFLKSQRKWSSPALTKTSIDRFKARMKTFGYDPGLVLPHGSYLINLGNPDDEKRQKSYDCFLDDLKRCEQLDLQLYNFHPGSTVGATTIENSLKLVAECLNKAHKETTSVITVIENMAGAGNVLGCTFEQLASIIEQVENKDRVGVCLDTCHLFASGYDIRTKDAYTKTMSEFSEKVGFKYLKGLHLNDSKTPLNSKKDRHENLGQGSLGLAAFAHVMHDPRMQGIPMILETESFEQPETIWAEEVRVLYELPADLEEGDGQKAKDLANRVKSAVAEASKSSKKGAKKPAKAGGKRKKQDTDEEDEDEDE